ncbi:MAG: sigma-54-dependent transcriptional regulator [Rhizobiaceae bacterium]
MQDSILIIDDDPVQRRLLEGLAKRMGYTPTTAHGGREALDILQDAAPKGYGAIILDLIMPEMDGITVLEKLRELKVATPVIVQTAQGGIETVVKAMRAGAFDFVVKPVSPERLNNSLAKAVKISSLETKRPDQKISTPAHLEFEDIVSASSTMKKVLNTAQKAARSQIPVLIEGESGVGKELISRAIQGSSPRSAGPFVTVNCGALPDNLVESILFGHEKGAFTGASDKHVGKFEEANGGTLFLDEIGELPLDMQVKLLRAIQEGEIDPIGSRKPVKVDIRLISATNRNLLEEIKTGTFREDLYYRLSVLPLTIPPLRERREDIKQLTRHFIKRFAAEENRDQEIGITQQAMAMLNSYNWPGNIRELENTIFRAVVLSDDDELAIDEFPQIATQIDGFTLPVPENTNLDIQSSVEPVEKPYSQSADIAATTPAHDDAGYMANGYLPLVRENGDVLPLDHMEAEIIRFAIRIYDGRMSEVAKKLGIGRSTLYRKLKDYGIEDLRDDIKSEKQPRQLHG